MVLTGKMPVLRLTMLEPLPEIRCHRTPTPPAIDGAADDPLWQQAQSVTAFHCLRQDASQPLAAPQFPTLLRCLWDDDFLYVRFDCRTPDVWAALTERDCELWNDPVVEVFLCPAPATPSFFEFQVNPIGTIYDSFVPDARLNADWQKWSRWNCRGLRVGVRVDGRLNDLSHRDQGWSAVMAIPFEALAEHAGARPRPGEAWRANFTRYERARELPQPELTSWSPVVQFFDDLPRFGRLLFV